MTAGPLLFLGAGLLCFALILGMMLGLALAIPFVLAGTVCLYVAIMGQWRIGVYGLVLYLPFAGLPTILLDPAPALVTQSKDLLFVVPTYLAFGAWLSRQRSAGSLIRVIPLGLLVGFVMLGVIQAFNPELPNRLVAVIGLKVRFFYLPIILIGYCFVDSIGRLLTLARVMVASAMLPAAVGIAQAVLLYSGRPDLAYAMYGDAASAVTQGYVRLGIIIDGFAGVARIPSTFTFVTQYWGFLLAITPVAYALVLASTGGERRRTGVRWFVALGVLLFAGLSSGARAAFVLFPVYFLISGILDFSWQRIWKPLTMSIVGVLVTAAVMDVPIASLLDYQTAVAGTYASREGLLGEVQTAFGRTWIGLGTGTSTGPARYAISLDPQELINQRGDFVTFESYYAATLLELGLPGLLLFVAILASLFIGSWRAFRQLRDPILRAFGVSLLALFIVMIGYFLKGSIIDYDPLNVYFWLFIGILLKLPLLERPIASVAPDSLPVRRLVYQPRLRAAVP